MEIKLEIPDYDKTAGIKYQWETGFEITVTAGNSQVLISANKAGLISLATQLLTLAQDSIPAGRHLFYSDDGGLKPGSGELTVEKV